jgi:glycosyltransferase involved in cell wall biosynthesis
MSPAEPDTSGNGLSVVIPTYNRAAILRETLLACAAAARGLPIEFIVVDDGSTDDTPQCLKGLEGVVPNLRWRSVPNGGPGQARNIGADLAQQDLVLFLGDDIRPCDDGFFRVHLDAHRQSPAVASAVLGKVIWPRGPDCMVNFVMQHIQGPSCEQFCYHRMQPYTWWDYRYFYTCNVSVKRRIVDNWLTEGFSPAFVAAAYEDTEFAYRMQNRCGMSIFYAPGSVGEHHHEYSFETFLNRQRSAGKMLKALLDLHPELACTFADGDVIAAIRSDRFRGDAAMAADTASVLAGIMAAARLLEKTQRLGSQNWHDDLLTALFRLAHSEGVLAAYASPEVNLTAGRLKVLETFQTAVARSMHREILGRQSLHGLFPQSWAYATDGRLKNKLKRNLGRIPGLRSVYRLAKTLFTTSRGR